MLQTTNEETDRLIELWRRLINTRQVDVSSRWRDYRGTITISDDDIIYALKGEWAHDPIELTLASYSDYHGASWDVANVRELVDTYGCESGGSWHSGSTAYVVIGEPQWTDEDRLTNLVEIIEGLDEYPAIDDESVSNYEFELADEAWDQFIRDDFADDSKHLFPEDEDDVYAQSEAAEEFLTLNEDIIREFYYEFQGNEWVAESATSIVNYRHKDAVEHAVIRTRVALLANA